MKAILKFKLPEEQEEFNNAIQGSNWAAICWGMDQWLRNKTKHAPDSMSKEAYKAYMDCRNELHEFFNGRGLNL